MNRATLLIILPSAIAAGCGGGDETASRNNDPLQSYQWYLFGDASRPDIVSVNLPANSRFTGRGVLVSIVDNGVDLDHEDLRNNITYGNHSYLPEDYDFSNADHGTAVAGLIAAEWGNGAGGRGVAPDARLVAFNAVRTPAIENLADALQRDIWRVDISNNSWGDFNSWGEPLALHAPVELALQKGVNQGRSGRGIVYVFSAGNGATLDPNGIPSDNINYSGLVNNYYTLPIGAVDSFGKKTSYSETGATLLVCAPSRGGDEKYGIFTTDVTWNLGYNNEDKTGNLSDRNYTRIFGGTSAAAPLVSGVVALMLEANPDLGWRDVREILARSARKVDPIHDDWTKNGAGLNVNHAYGFGLVDATAAINMALTWLNALPAKVFTSRQDVGRQIPDGSDIGLSGEISVPDIGVVEFVEVLFDAPDHPRLGDLEITLISPSGTKSVLSEVHNQTFEVFRYRNWRFGTVRVLGERTVGSWRLEVRDRRIGNVGSWTSWTLVVHSHDIQS